ncbi:hypothetical protein [Micromonospora fulviviridis]|uniref:hypothetical protein n=1 Tax=Micromonospora fulviviridis TaxID=47860 RepID=UPI0037AE0EF3
MAETLVEIHVPLVAASGLSDGDYQFPWIEDIEDFLVDLEERGEVEVYDDGEEWEDVYIFFISGADEAALLAVASRVAKLRSVPPGAFAVVTDVEADEYGQGRRVALASL